MSTIMIVDDEPSARETLISILDGLDYRLEIVNNGNDVIQCAEQIQPDLILLDVMMPGMDGYQVCHRIRTHPRLAEVPIIILSALDDRKSLLRGIESGADDFLSKPIDRHELRARVRTITGLNRYRTLVEQRENLRKMAEKVVSAQEEERQRISRELHDDLGQALTTNLMALRDLQDDLSIPVEVMFTRLQTLYEQSYEIFVKVRRLAQDLRPPVLDALGLKTSIQTYCAEFTRRTQLPVHLDIDPDLPTLPDVHNITLYRCLQEALTNIVKHAQATQAWVELSAEDHTVFLTVQDNGIGLPEKPRSPNGIGLSGLRERLTIAGGKLHIKSIPHQGTILTAQLPISDAQLQKRQDD